MIFIAQTTQPAIVHSSDVTWALELSDDVVVIHAADSVPVCKDLFLTSLPRMELRADPVVATLEMSETESKDSESSEGDGDYESLPPHASLTTHMTAGAVAGILEHTVMYPVDSVKVQ